MLMARPHNPTPLSPDRSELAARYLPFARKIAKPYKDNWPRDPDEFDSAVCLALVEAAQSFDPGRNIKFATYARHRIWGALRDVQRDMVLAGWRSDREHAPGFLSLLPRAEEYGRLMLTTPDPRVGEELERAELLESWLKKLPAHYAAACRAIYLRGETQAQAAAALGTSKSRISAWLKEALVILRDIAATSPAWADDPPVATGPRAEEFPHPAGACPPLRGVGTPRPSPARRCCDITR
jgi:RNA polymerase sigma factor (sigma-70 family)